MVLLNEWGHKDIYYGGILTWAQQKSFCFEQNLQIDVWQIY